MMPASANQTQLDFMNKSDLIQFGILREGLLLKKKLHTYFVFNFVYHSFELSDSIRSQVRFGFVSHVKHYMFKF